MNDAHPQDAAFLALEEIVWHEVLHVLRAELVQVEHAVDGVFDRLLELWRDVVQFNIRFLIYDLRAALAFGDCGNFGRSVIEKTGKRDSKPLRRTAGKWDWVLAGEFP